ncbi:4'-phosphopantetheinyl transferase superfamily protein [Paenarthrobacter sp. NPDC089675]|uniref:4'-phosphopantetheinyl transferase family protein n=1 Tax=Paenarthrobacter sp. NPDC089675 TaxID=3364376 RepID=UPI0037FDDFFD
MAIAVAAARFLGVDVAATEWRRGLDVFFEIHGTGAEKRWLKRQPDHVTGAAMMWTAKEALAKAKGVGLATRWDGLELIPISGQKFSPAREALEVRTSVHSLCMDGLALSVAFPEGATVPQILDWRFKSPCVCTANRTER